MYSIFQNTHKAAKIALVNVWLYQVLLVMPTMGRYLGEIFHNPRSTNNFNLNYIKCSSKNSLVMSTPALLSSVETNPVAFNSFV